MTLLQDLRPGMRLHGGVVGVTDFAAFLDVKVVRKGPGGKLVRCNAMLHPHDVPPGTTLIRDAPPGQARQQQPTPLETDPAVIRRGIHVTVYVKDVFPNSGRFSVTLDPTVDKQKVVIARRQKRELSKKRNKVKKLEGVEEGLEKKAQVVKLLRTALLVDIGLPVPAFLPHSSIPESVPLEDVRQVGVLMTVRLSEKTDKQIKCEMMRLLPPTSTAPGRVDE
ncbi:nucleic acid-binding protein [Nannochloropsis oceanica]